MGSPLGGLSDNDSIDLDDLEGEVIAIDGNLDLYQYITAITDDWNDYVRNDEGQPISHLIGLISRYGQVLKHGIRPIYVFDGGYPELKEETVESRKTEGAVEKFQQAKANGEKKKARKLAYQKTAVTPFMQESATELLESMGIPVVQAPAEGEPQAAQFVHDGIADHVVSEDWDTILYDVPTLVRNFRTSGAEIAHRDRILINQGWRIGKLRWYCVLRGSDYNKSVKGIGPVRGKQIVSDADSFEDVMDAAESYGDVNRERWRKSLELFEEPEVESHHPDDITWGRFNRDDVHNVACLKYGLADWQVESRLANVEEQWF